MKKVININFQGRVTPIEESAYDVLKQYVESLRNFFANEEGKDEIINDIESRIAELFSERLKNGSTCITDDDVESIIAGMGRPEDFDNEEVNSTTSYAGNQYSNSTNNEHSTPHSRGSLYRDINEKILGGVCGGLAAYFKIDPSIMRVIFVVFTFSGGAGILLYILLWIILPARPLKYASTTNRLYRNPDEKVLAGVASGIAAYFNIAVWIPRLIFALPLVTGIISSIFRTAFWFHVNPFPGYMFGSFGGTLFIIYAVLWAVIPEAKSASEKLAMRGKKVDLNSIKNTIQDDLGSFKTKTEKWGAEFSQKAKEMGIEFGDTISAKGKEFGTEASNFSRSNGSKLLNAIGILFKAFFLFIAGIIGFALLVSLLAVMIASIGAFPLKDFFLEGFWQNTLAWSSLILFLLVPILGIVIWIIRRIMGVKSQNNILRWAFAGLWTLGWGSIIVLIALFSRNFNAKAKDKKDISITQPSTNKLIVTVADVKVHTVGSWIKIDRLINIDNDSISFNNINLRVAKSNDANYHISYNKLSYGIDEETALKNVAQMNYGLLQTDSIIYLNRGLDLPKTSKFRNQGVIVTILVPIGKKIEFDETVDRRLNWINIKQNKHDFDWEDEDWDGNDFRGFNANIEYIMTAGGLERSNRLREDNSNLNEKMEEYRKSKEELKEEYERKKKEMDELKKELDKSLDTGVIKNQKVTLIHPTKKSSVSNLKIIEIEEAVDALTLGSNMSLLSIQSLQ